MSEDFEIGSYKIVKRGGSGKDDATWYEPGKRGQRGRTKRASLGTDDFQEAQIKLAKWILENSKPQKKHNDDALVEELLLIYWNEHAQHTAGSEASRYCLSKWTDYFSQAVVSEVTLDEQKRFLKWLTESGASLSYCQRIFGIGRAAFNYAWHNGRIVSPPYIMTPKAAMTYTSPMLDCTE